MPSFKDVVPYTQQAFRRLQYVVVKSLQPTCVSIKSFFEIKALVRRDNAYDTYKTELHKLQDDCRDLISERNRIIYGTQRILIKMGTTCL